MYETNGFNVPPYIVGDSMYPLLSWVMKPFSHSIALSDDKRTLNYRLSRARIVVENAFGRLKARWRRLMKRNDMHVDKIPTVIAACCVLHNMCEIHHQQFNDRWSLDNGDQNVPQPQSRECHTDEGDEPKEIRDALMQYFISHPI